MKPGDKFTSESGATYTVLAPLAYQGKAGCEHPLCTRVVGESGCRGYHCSVCDEPCSMMGHAKCAGARDAMAGVERDAPGAA